MFYVCDSTVGASHPVPVQPGTPGPVPSSKDFSINTTAIDNTSKTTSTTQSPAAKPNLTVTKTSKSVTMLTTTARNQTTLSAQTLPSGPGNVYTSRFSLTQIHIEL